MMKPESERCGRFENVASNNPFQIGSRWRDAGGDLKFRSPDREKASQCQAKVASFSKGSSRGRPTIWGRG